MMDEWDDNIDWDYESFYEAAKEELVKNLEYNGKELTDFFTNEIEYKYFDEVNKLVKGKITRDELLKFIDENIDDSMLAEVVDDIYYNGSI